MWAKLGNTAPVEVVTGADGEQVRRPVAAVGEAATEVVFPPTHTLIEAFLNVTHPGGIWASHSDAPPAWVMSDSPELAAMLAANYQASGATVEVRAPGGEG